MARTISVIGGDLRQLTLAELLQNDGFDVFVFGFGENSKSDIYKFSKNLDEALNSDILILPMPLSIDKINLNTPFQKEKISLSDLKSTRASLILGGRIFDEIYELFENKTVIDYYEREELMIKNSVPTAEGAIELAICETPFTLSHSNILIAGYGRISKVLSRLLKEMGANVSISARKYSDLAWIDVNGYNAIHSKDIEKNISSYDIIFNTVPALLFDENALKKVKKDTLIIDLASKPGGVDFEKAQDLGVRVIWALSLPGKTAPLTSGNIIKETVSNILYEEGYVW